jgi:hypothetical protein
MSEGPVERHVIGAAYLLGGGGGNRTDSDATVYSQLKCHSYDLNRENTVSVSRRH